VVTAVFSAVAVPAKITIERLASNRLDKSEITRLPEFQNEQSTIKL
jgi:hypothetical protein